MSTIDQSQPILVYLAAGVQGSAVVRAALQRGFKVRALVRDRRRATALSALGVELAEGTSVIPPRFVPPTPASPTPCCRFRSDHKATCASRPIMRYRLRSHPA